MRPGLRSFSLLVVEGVVDGAGEVVEVEVLWRTVVAIEAWPKRRRMCSRLTPARSRP